MELLHEDYHPTENKINLTTKNTAQENLVNNNLLK